MPRIRFRLSTLLLVVTAVAVCLWLVTMIATIQWDGGYDLNVKLQRETGTPIQELSYAAFAVREIADAVLLKPGGVDDWKFETLPTVSESVIVPIRAWGTANAFGRELAYEHERFVVLWIVYVDGRETRILVESPPGHGPRAVAVSIP